MSGFDRRTYRRLKMVAKPFFVSEVKWRARGLIFLLICFSLSVSGINVLMSYVGRDFMTALSLKEKDEFFKQLWRYLGMFALATPVVVFYRYTEERLGLMWRRWLANRMLSDYFSNHAYYKLNWLGGIDNPDQRLVEDTRSFTATSLSFLLIILNSIITLFAFMGILWSISINLVIAVILYAAIGSVITYYLGRPLIGLNFSQLKKEADFRYKLVNVRDNVESIAFYRGERKEYIRVRQRLKKAVQNLKDIIDWNRNLSFFTTSYNYIITILPTIIVAPLYLDGQIEFGVVSQAAMAFGHALGALSIIVLNFGSISAFGAVVTRLGTFWEGIEESGSARLLAESEFEIHSASKLIFEHVTILTPTGEEHLVKDLSLNFEKGGLLITGPSGCGKSSVLRVIAGLWTAGNGRITRPEEEQSMFVPQRPYMILGSLRSQVLYTASSAAIPDRKLLAILRSVGLEEMYRRVGGFDAVLDWPNILSTGEQQRIAFARLLLRQPRFVFLDEATTALDPASEEMIYELLRQTVGFFVSVGHREALAKYHDLVLELKGNGLWSIDRIRN